MDAIGKPWEAEALKKRKPIMGKKGQQKKKSDTGLNKTEKRPHPAGKKRQPEEKGSGEMLEKSKCYKKEQRC